MKNKRFISVITVMAIFISLFANTTVLAENETYTADFTKLEAKTYGTAEDIIMLDDYTTAYLTHEGTYVDSNHVIHLTGTNTGKGAYTNGSYVQFTAPSDGTVSFDIAYANYFVGSDYKGYSSASVDLKAEQTLTIGERDTAQSTISAITFIPKQTPTVTEIATPYTSPQTKWDFDTYLPAEEGKNVPVISGASEYNDGDIKFKSNDKATGTLAVDFDEPIKNNVEFSFDITEHKDSGGKYTLSGRYIEYKILNSENEEIVYLSAHPYAAETEASNFIKIGNAEIDKTKSEIQTAFDKRGTEITTSVDYHARKVTITMGTNTFEGEIPASAMKDIAKFEFSVRLTNSVSADRYITLDNLAVKEFTSTAPAAPAGEITNGYEAKTFGGVNSRVKAPDESAGKPLVVFLSSKSRFGTDNEGQLYQAQYFFDLLDGKATLAAPQTETAWETDALKTYITAAKAEYNSSKVIVIGQNEGAAAAYALSDTADKIIPINGISDITAATAKVWAFSGYLDENIADIRTTVAALQKSKADVMYTEFPFDSGNIAEKVSETTDLEDWILNDTENSKIVDLVLFAGQSNMAGRGDYADATECAAGHGFEYHSVTEPGVLTTVNEPFGKYENNDAVNDFSGTTERRSGDMVSSFMESYYKVSGVPIVGVQCSRGGTDTNYWTNADRLTELAARYNEAKTYLEDSGYTIRNKFMVWCQGETDADKGRTTDTHKNNVMTIFNSVKTNTGLTNMFIVRIGHCRSGNALDEEKDPVYKAINLAQKELADANEDITAVASFYTDEYLALMRDNYHYYQGAYNSIGNIAGNNTAVTLYNKGTWIKYPEPDEVIEPTEPEYGKITIEGTTVTVAAKTDENDTPILIHAVRGANDILENVKTYNLTFENNTASKTITSLKNGDELYVWGSLSGMKPLAEKKIVTEISQSVQQ